MWDMVALPDRKWDFSTMLRSLARLLPAPLLNPLKRVYMWAEALAAPPQAPDLPTVASGPAVPVAALDPRDPFSFVPADQLAYLDACFRGYHRNEMLQIRLVRQVLARERMKTLVAQGAVRRFEGSAAGVAANTLEYNYEGALTSADLDRPSMMFDLVKAIGRVAQRIDTLDALSIGPRSEIEIFGMMAAGFHPDRIKAVDLFSYSPYVDVGDMHALPYADNSFDIVFLGWVLSYSKDQAAVARELVRVGRDRAILVLAGDYSDASRDRPTFQNETTHMQNCDQILSLFGDQVGRVYFRHDPELPDVAMVMTAFEIRKT